LFVEAEGYGDCKYCGKRYMNIRWLFKHVKDHENNIPRGAENKSGVPLYKCSCCKMSFFTKEESLAHQQSTHADILSNGQFYKHIVCTKVIFSLSRVRENVCQS
jgi:hypothetical protein